MTLDGLMAQTTVDSFRDSLVNFFFNALIVQPYQGLASKAMMQKARDQIETTMNRLIGVYTYRSTRDIYLYIHLIQGRTALLEKLSQAQRETADENRVDTEQLALLLEAFYSRLKADFESHHDRHSRS